MRTARSSCRVAALRLGNCTSVLLSRYSSTSTSSTSQKPRGLRIPKDDGISDGLRGIGVYGGSISAFMKSESEKRGAKGTLGDSGDSALPCDVAGSQAAIQAAQAQYMASVAMTGQLPSPRNAFAEVGQLPEGPLSLPSRPQQVQRRPSSLSVPSPPQSQSTKGTPSAKQTSSLPKRALPATAARSTSSATSKAEAKFVAQSGSSSAGTKTGQEAADYYRSVPRNELSKEEMWSRILSAKTDKAELNASALQADEVDYFKLEEEMREHDLMHYRIGEMAFSDEAIRRDYYAMWNLSMALNKARWTMLEVHSQRGMKTTGAGMKLLFWKEAVGSIIDHRQMSAGQFTESHPVLRPFAAAVEHNPKMTKAFVRGFTDARLKVIQQPGSVKQLFDHFDKYYGYFFNSLLEVIHVKDENAEHMLMHIGRATGLATHCVMFWKKYARIGFTMLPADLCADNHVNLALLKNISLASRDRAVQKLLYDVMCIVKDEMVHAEQLAKEVPPTAWPVVMECFYANYYLGFLQRHEFNVSAMFADHNIENAGYVWYRVKKRWEWERYQSIERLVSEAAPLPFIGTSYAHRGSKYRMATGISAQRRSPLQ